MRFYVMFMSHTSVYEMNGRFGKGMRSDPLRMECYHCFNFGPMGPFDSKNLFVIYSGIKSLEKF